MKSPSTYRAMPRAMGWKRLRTPCARWTSAVLALGCLLPAWGQPLSDPARPPQAWLTAPQKGAGAPASAPAAAERERPPQLQSLLIGPSGRYAIIDGQLVGVGDTF